MPFDFCDLLLSPFPFTNPSAFYQRPSFVVSSKSYNTDRPDVIIMPITSQLLSSSRKSYVLISEYQQANLLKPSSIKPLFATLKQHLIISRLLILQAQTNLRCTRHASLLLSFRQNTLFDPLPPLRLHHRVVPVVEQPHAHAVGFVAAVNGPMRTWISPSPARAARHRVAALAQRVYQHIGILRV